MNVSQRIVAGLAAVGLVAGMAVGAAGAARAGTMPVTRPGEPTVAMTITNHTDQPEFLVSSFPAGGEWVNAPRQYLAPGATEVVTAVAPGAPYLNVNAAYRIGNFGPIANYQIKDMQGTTDTALTGVTGSQYAIITNLATAYPNANVTYDQW